MPQASAGGSTAGRPGGPDGGLRRAAANPPYVTTSRLLDQGTPFGVSSGLAGDQVEVGLLQLLGDRATTAGADLAAVQFADRGHFGGGAGEEGLVGDVHLVAGDALLDDLHAQLAGQGQHGVAGDAV